MKILITGGTNGMGKGVAKVLASKDSQAHELIILCRSKALGQALIDEIKRESHNTKISIVLCDLSKLEDVKNAVLEIKKHHTYLDGIFINAGIGYAAKQVETIDGMDAHFQVNYLSQFMLTLNLIDLLELAPNGGRILFNATKYGEIHWDDLQMKNKWTYESGIFQAMAAKRMFLVKLHELLNKKANISFIGFQIHSTVWTNQINKIPILMKSMAKVMKLFGQFISIEECGEIIAPLLTENHEMSMTRSGKLISWKKGSFIELEEEDFVLNRENQDRLWKISLELCDDQRTYEINRNFGDL